MRRFLGSCAGKLRLKAPRRRPFHVGLFDDEFFWDAAIARPQRMMQQACNSGRIDRRLLARAMRQGGSFDGPAYLDGSLPHHFHARHGQTVLDWQQLLGMGADPEAVDLDGRAAAHYAFIARNPVLCPWFATRRPELCLRPDAGGASAAEMALRECLHGDRSEEEEAAFLDWTLQALGEPARALFAERGFRSALAGIHPEARGLNLTAFARLERMGAEPPEPLETQAALERCPASLRTELAACLGAIVSRAEGRRLALACQAPDASFGVRRGL